MTFDKKAYYQEYNKKYYANLDNLNRRREGQNARRKANPELAMFNRAKSRAKEKEVPFNITVDDVKIPTHCPILGIELRRGVDKLIPESPTLDRIHNDLGDVKGNVAVISHKANALKRESTIEILERLIKYMKGDANVGDNWSETH